MSNYTITNKNMITSITVQNSDGTTQVFTDQSTNPTIQSITVPLNTPIILVGIGGNVGTITVQAGSGTVVGVGTTFTRDFVVGNQITVNGETQIVSSVESDTSLTTGAWSQNASNVGYVIVR